MATTFAKIALAGGLFLGVLAFAENRASAMPLADQSVAAVATPAQAVEKTRWVCGPYRCWWRPGWGWHRPWGWHRWGWHRHWGWHRWHRWHHWRRW
jgi:hypothetical protein